MEDQNRQSADRQIFRYLSGSDGISSQELCHSADLHTDYTTNLTNKKNQLNSSNEVPGRPFLLPASLQETNSDLLGRSGRYLSNWK